MNKTLALLLLAIPLALPGCVVAPSQPSRMDVGGAYRNDGSSFYFSLSEYYGVPERDVIYIHEQRIPDDEIPVVLFISQRARVSPSLIINLRLSGRSWMDISLHYGLGPDVYYIPVQGTYGPPYGHAYGHFHNRNRNEWHKIRLSDDDVVNMANLRFISEHHRLPPDEVMRMRSSGRNFVNIDNEARRNPRGAEQRQQERRDYREPRMQQDRNEREYRQQERRDARDPEMRQERRDTREQTQQQERQQREYRQQERRDARDPEMRQEREMRQQERRNGRDAAPQQGATQESRPSERRNAAQEPAAERNRQKQESRKKERSDEDNSAGPQDRKGRGNQRGAEDAQPR